MCFICWLCSWDLWAILNRYSNKRLTFVGPAICMGPAICIPAKFGWFPKRVFRISVRMKIFQMIVRTTESSWILKTHIGSCGCHQMVVIWSWEWRQGRAEGKRVVLEIEWWKERVQGVKIEWDRRRVCVKWSFGLLAKEKNVMVDERVWDLW